MSRTEGISRHPVGCLFFLLLGKEVGEVVS